jgi:hypothetical protein
MRFSAPVQRLNPNKMPTVRCFIQNSLEIAEVADAFRYFFHSVKPAYEKSIAWFEFKTNPNSLQKHKKKSLRV